MVLARRTAVAMAAMALLAVPLGLPKFYLLLATEILIMGLFAIPVPRALSGPRGRHRCSVAVVVRVRGLLWRVVHAPFGRTVRALGGNAERAEFGGLHARRLQLAAFVISGALAGLSWALSP